MLFIKLILAHLLGDFIFQPNSWVADKERKKAKSLYLYLHTFIHFALIMFLLWDLHLWWIAAAVAGSHFIIDLAKLQYQKPNTRKNWFFIDQLLHILVIAGITLYVMKFDFSFIDNSDLLKVIAGAVFVTVPASIIVKMLISGWTPAKAMEVPVTILRASGATERFLARAAVETSLDVEVLVAGGVIPLILRRELRDGGSTAGATVSAA